MSDYFWRPATHKGADAQIDRIWPLLEEFFAKRLRDNRVTFSLGPKEASTLRAMRAAFKLGRVVWAGDDHTAFDWLIDQLEEHDEVEVWREI